ncbi:MAG: hypothetical protein E7029_09140 [Planctomycetaceae bacterium]|nr:hypothetical protein [Planctomycetaceae bacterium]
MEEEKHIETQNTRKFPMRYVMVGAAAAVSALISLVFSISGNFGNFQNGPDNFTPLFSGKLFTESELLEIEMAFADAELTQYTISNGQVQVPPQKKNDFIRALKKTSLFKDEHHAQDHGMAGLWISERERQAAELKGKQNELAGQLRTFRGIENAGVILDISETKNGFERQKHATASISIRSREGHTVSQEDIQSILRLVTGAVYGLSSANVSIIDTRTNQSWKFNAPEIETGKNADETNAYRPDSGTSGIRSREKTSSFSENETDAESAAHLEKIVFQPTALPRPEIFDSGARGMLASNSPRPVKAVDTELLSLPKADFSENDFSDASAGTTEPSCSSMTDHSENMMSGRVIFAGSSSSGTPEIRRVSTAEYSQDRSFSRQDIRLTSASSTPNAPTQTVSETEVSEMDLSASQKLQDCEETELLPPETPRSSNDAAAVQEPLSQMERMPIGKKFSRFSIKSSTHKSQELFLFFCIVAILVIFICLLVIYMTRKGLFTAAMLRERMQMKVHEKETDEENADSEIKPGLQMPEISDAQEVSETSPFSSSGSGAKTPAEEKISKENHPTVPSDKISNGFENLSGKPSEEPSGDFSESSAAESASARKGKIADILATLESLKNEPPFFPEAPSEDSKTSASAQDAGLNAETAADLTRFQIPEIEELQTFPPKRVALALLEERPQTAAMLLHQFSKAGAQAVLNHIPANLRLGIESRMTSCTEPDREILREAAAAILEYLEELELENGRTPAESIFLQKEEKSGSPVIRPLAEVLPHTENSGLTDRIPLHELFPIPENERNAQEEKPLSHETEDAEVSELPVSELPVSKFADSNELPAQLEKAPEIADPAVSEAVPENFIQEETGKFSGSAPEDRTETLPFDALKQFSKKDLRVLLAANPQEKTILALLGAEQRLMDRLLGVLPKSEAHRVRKQLKYPSQIRLQDVEDARISLMLLAHELAESGQIRLPEMAESI